MTTSGSSSGGSPMDQLRYEVWLLAGEAVGGLPRDVAQEDVDLEALLYRLTLQQRLLERAADGGDEVDEEVIQHVRRRIDGPRASRLLRSIV
jgi:hypothetical protein